MTESSQFSNCATPQYLSACVVEQETHGAGHVSIAS